MKDDNVKKLIFVIVLFIAALGAFVFASYKLFAYYMAYDKISDDDKEIYAVYESSLRELKNRSGTEDENEDKDKDDDKDDDENGGGKSEGQSLYALKQINPDTVFFLDIPGTKIGYPVVKRDAEYYLTHTFKGETDPHGAVFMDENCDVNGDIILLHGHHMKDGTMFGGLKYFKKDDYRKDHPVIYLDDGSKISEYRISAALMIDMTKEGYFEYTAIPENDDEKKAYLDNIKKLSFFYDKKLMEDKENDFLILSTCDYGTADQRMLLVSVKR